MTYDPNLHCIAISEAKARAMGFPEDAIAKAKEHPQGLIDFNGYRNMFLHRPLSAASGRRHLFEQAGIRARRISKHRGGRQRSDRDRMA